VDSIKVGKPARRYRSEKVGLEAPGSRRRALGGHNRSTDGTRCSIGTRRLARPLEKDRSADGWTGEGQHPAAQVAQGRAPLKTEVEAGVRDTAQTASQENTKDWIGLATISTKQMLLV
jgi:hypothetical protein